MKSYAWIWVLFGGPLIVSVPAQTGTTSPSAAPTSTGVSVAAQPTVPLSQATLEKIARMKPIFDGKTLDGWIQAPPAPNTISATDFKNVSELVKKLTGKS